MQKRLLQSFDRILSKGSIWEMISTVSALFYASCRLYMMLLLLPSASLFIQISNALTQVVEECPVLNTINKALNDLS